MTVHELQKKLTDMLYKGYADYETGVSALEADKMRGRVRLIDLEAQTAKVSKAEELTPELPFKRSK